MKEEIGYIGLGNLGFPMANNLLETGYSLRLYNRSAAKAEPLVAKGAQMAASPVDVVIPGGIVVTVLWDDESVENVVNSAGFLERLGQGGIHISMTTILPETSKRLAALHAAHGSAYIDATVFGALTAAADRQLWIPFSGPQAAKEKVRAILEAMGGKGIFDFGEEPGAANLVKIVGNFLIVSAGRSLYEALTMADKNGVDAHAVVQMLTQTLFSAPIYQSYGQRIADKNPAFGQSRIPQKDIGLFKNIGREVDMSTPIADNLGVILNSVN